MQVKNQVHSLSMEDFQKLKKIELVHLAFWGVTDERVAEFVRIATERQRQRVCPLCAKTLKKLGLIE